MLLTTLMGMSAMAQQRNVLQIPDVTVQRGNAQLPVSIENTDEIVGVQFDLTLPEGITAGQTGTMANRGDGHTVTISRLGSGAYRVLLHSSLNRPLLGQSGVVMYLPISIPSSFEEGSEHLLAISNAVLGKVTGENVLTETVAGMIRIAKLPDLTVKNITAAVVGGDSPTVFTPGDRIVCSWQVENIGELATGGGWREQVSLVSEDGTLSKLIATTHYDDILDASGIVSRQAEITLPALLGIDGQVRVQVRLVPDSNTGEDPSAQGNNTLTSANVMNVNKVLTMELSPNRVEENASSRIALRVNRSGRWEMEETFTLTATADSRVAVPASITIPANQSGAIIYMSIADNEVLDDNETVVITASGNNYPDATCQLSIEDNEYPDLTVTASKTEITEGETFQLTVTTSRVSAQPIVVTISSENTKRFSFPQTVTIPAGETSAVVDVMAVDDELPSLVLSNAFTVSAPKYNKAETIVILQDNDLPVLELTLTPSTVQESAGVVAVAGVLRRTTNTNSKITVKLTDNANGGLYFGNRTLTLDKGIEEVHFNFGPVDNALVDGNRTYTITAAVWLSSCSCGASGESAGYVEAQLQVFDNDGPALGLTSSLSTVKEGENATLTVSRNTTDTSSPLTVTLTSDYDEGLTYNHTVTIPAGQSTATVEIASAANDVQGDSHTVIFTVQANGYATGTCYVMVTDQTLPDARITNITADVTEGEVGSKAKLTITVANDGATELPAEVVLKIYRRGDSNAVGTVYTNEAIAVGGSTTVVKTIALPASVGTHSYYAVVNESHNVQELSYNNNTSVDVTISTVSPFSVAVNTDKTIYNQGENIVITGQLTGNNIAETDIDIYLINEGARQVQTVKTDANGAFSYEWELYALQSGHFVVGACYPGETKTEEMAVFDVYGLRRTNNDFITCETKLGEQYEGVITVENPGQLPQTITSFEVVSKPDACEVILEAPTTIAANGTAQLKYKLTGSAVTETKDWETIVAKLTSKEGSTLTVTLYYYCTANYAVLTTNTTSIKTTMTKGTSRDYLLNVMNTGKEATGKIRVLIPDVDWMKLNTPAEMPSLEYGETATINLRLTPTDDMPLNLPYTGRIALNCDNGTGVSVNYNIEVVSEATGVLNVDVVDEYTYYTEEKPHVAGADVVVKHPVTGAIVAQGKTGDDGIYSVELPEGYYTISVTEGHHNSTTGNILIDPGIVNNQEVFLSYTAITYSWDVVETEVEDEYKIETIAKFETNVPKPVVVVNLPTERPTDGSIIAIVVTNKGLINAQNVVMNLDCTDGYELELLNPDPVEILASQQSYVFYARFKKNSNAHSRRKIWGNPDVDCLSIFAGALYDYMCGNAKNMEEALAQNGWGDCIGDGDGGSTPPWHIRPIPHTGPNWPGGPGGGGWGDSDPSDDGPGVLETLRQWYCSLPCGKELTQALACEAANRIKDAIIPDWLDCVYNLANEGLYGNWEGLIGQMLDCAGLPNPFDDGCWGPYIRCMLDHYDIHFSRSQNRLSPSHDRKYETVFNFNESKELLNKEGKAYRRIAKELFGDEEWLECESHELAAILEYVNIKGNNYSYTSNDFASLKPQSITDKKLEVFVERINNTYHLKDTGYEGIDNYINPDTIAFYSDIIDFCEETAKNGGWDNVGKKYESAYNELQDYLEEGESSVCASVSIKISQTMAMTRQAFRGTLTVFNGNEETTMQNVKLKLEVVNKATGEIATAHEFQINAESLDGFTGQLELGSGWTLDAKSTGTATVLFIPTNYAAPTEPVEWSFGGTLSYVDPFTGLEVTRELYPVTLTVKPCPELDLTYFMQRDVYGDDPLTIDVDEPMKPAEFALLINNKGYGDANNVRMVTQQPEIIDNEKGLKIDFELVSSQVNGGDATLSFGQSIANDFGTIPAHSQLYAQWWLTSTLLGHFTDYNVEATHVTSYGNENLSLLDQVTIHELIHGFDMPAGSLTGGPEKGRAFLVNDVTDADDLPDRLYFSNGETAGVGIAASATANRTSPTTCLLTVTPSEAGWNYGSVLDPTHGYAELKSIVRQSDGMELGSTRFWQTDRTLRDGKDWLYEYRLHFVDEFASQTAQTYLLTFEPVPETVLEVASIGVVPAEGEIAEEPIETLTVTFNKGIDASTFTGDDITFNVQGVKQDASQIGISTQDNRNFTLDMSGMNDMLPNGYYTMSVQTADITDAEGYQGKNGKQVGWIMFRGGLVQLQTSAYPAMSGTVSRRQSDAAGARESEPNDGNDDAVTYGSVVTLEATPATGYKFLNWTLNGKVVSTDEAFETTALGDMNVVANFTKKNYMVNVGVEGVGGTTEGTATGIYEHGTPISVTAIPDEDYILQGWTVNGEPAGGSNSELTLVADQALDIQASFLQEYYRQSMTMARGWNWISAYLSEPLPVADLSRYANRILSQTDELINDPEYGMVGGLTELTAGQSYKIEAVSRSSNSFRGHLYDTTTKPITLHKGWNWIAFPFMERGPVTMVTNAEEGDFITSQTGFAEYADGTWAGTLDMFTPGSGYLYKSVESKQLAFDPTMTVSQSRSWGARTATVTEQDIDIHRYPSTMNVTADICRDGTTLDGNGYTIYALVGDELRGISQCVDGHHYLTVYGEAATEISFVIENAETGESYEAGERLTFRSDVVGSRKSPFAFNMGNATGIDTFDGSTRMTVYTLEGILVSRDATLKMLRRLPKGVYIVNGQKRYVK